MAEKQELIWISAKSSYGLGKGKFLVKGDKVDGIIPDEDIPHFKKTGEVGAVAPSSSGVEIDQAYENLKSKYEALKEKLDEYSLVSDSIVEALGADSLKKDVKLALIKDLEDLR